MFDRNGNSIAVGKCVYGREDVTQEQHKQHNHIVEVLWTLEVAGMEEMFVHVRGADDEFDTDYIPYVCDRHFVAELNQISAEGNG